MEVARPVILIVEQNFKWSSHAIGYNWHTLIKQAYNAAIWACAAALLGSPPTTRPYASPLTNLMRREAHMLDQWVCAAP